MTDPPDGRIARRDRAGPALAAARRRHCRARSRELRPRAHDAAALARARPPGGRRDPNRAQHRRLLHRGLRGRPNCHAAPAVPWPRPADAGVDTRDDCAARAASHLPQRVAVVSSAVRARDGGELPVDRGRGVGEPRGQPTHTGAASSRSSASWCRRASPSAR